MRIGLSGRTTGIDRIAEQAVEAEERGPKRCSSGVRAMNDVSYEHLRFEELALPKWP